MAIKIRLRRRQTLSVIVVIGFLLVVYELAKRIDGISVAYTFHYTNVRNTAILKTGNKDNPGCNCDHNGQSVIDKCEVIHISIVSAGSSSIRSTTTLIKSVLFHRRNPLHFHFVVDKQSKEILTTLFDTWSLPAVEISVYDMDKVLQSVSWISNKHYSGIFGLVKLTLPDLLPSNVEKVLVLDADVLVVTDISKLWVYWSRMNQSASLGLVDNQSRWYLGDLWKGQIAWPAIGRGFNTGVIMMNLAKLRGWNWAQKWTEVARKHLQSFNNTALADQDIINALIKEHPYLVYQLPCEWNLQLGDRAQQHQLCTVHPNDVKIVHWNSPLKFQVRGRYAEYFRRHQQSAADVDGALFGTDVIECSNGIYNKTNEFMLQQQYDYYDDDDGCYDYKRAGDIIYRTHLYYRHFSHESQGDYDVTLVSQLSSDRVQLLSAIAEHWSGPISVAVYATDAEAHKLITFFDQSPSLADRTNIAVHVLFRQGVHYPINKLRNTALKHVHTPNVFMIDVDFVPMNGLYDQLKLAIQLQGSMERRALVVAAFESPSYQPDKLPKSKEELLNMMDTGQTSVFREQLWAKGHAQTNYDKWRTATAPYSVGWRNDYEPYVVVSRDVPLYDTRFVGFGWNKVSHIMQLDSLGYDFIVLPDVFITHMPHAPSIDIAQYRNSAQYRRCLKLLKSEFIKDLTKQRNNRTRVVPMQATPVQQTL